MNETKAALAGSESELGPLQREVLAYIWEHPGCCVRDCRESLAGRGRELAYTTVQTVFDALHRKRLVNRRRTKNAYRYQAAKSRGGLFVQGLHELFARFGRGSEPVASSLVDALEEGDRAELDALIGELKARGYIQADA